VARQYKKKNIKPGDEYAHSPKHDEAETPAEILRFQSAVAKAADAGCLLTLPISLRNSRHPSRMRLAIWIVGLTALATSLDSAYGGFYGRAIARMLTDMANGFGLG
jgi:hypothetical protein